MRNRAFYLPMKNSLRYILILLSVVLCVEGSSLSYASDDKYVIGREDVIDVAVWKSPELTQTLAVDADGNIQYGFLGSVTAAGRTPEDLKNEIADKLAQGYVNDPKVNVIIKEYNSKKILVFGEVEKPGLYKIQREAPVLEMLFLFGGVKPEAKRMTVIRPLDSNTETQPAALKPSDAVDAESTQENNTVHEVDLIALLSKGDLSQNITIRPGDTIYVASGTGEKFYVLGQVKNPGPIEWTGEITALEAIKLAGGPAKAAALNRIMVRKNSAAGNVETKVNATDIMSGKTKDDTIVEPGTIVIVPRSWV